MKLKKLFAGLISLAAALIAVCAITVCAGATNVDFNYSILTSGDFKYSIQEDGTLCIIDYKGDNANITIPSTIDGRTVTMIGYGAFLEKYYITSVIIPDSVTYIGGSAFYFCESLKSVTIPDGVTYVGEFAFYRTPFIDNQTSTVKYAGKWVVDCDDDATTAEIKNDTVGIADYAFGSCKSLTSVIIPDSVTYIGEDVFNVHSPLIANQSTAVKYVDKWVVDCDKTATTAMIQSGTVGIASSAFVDCSILTSTNFPKSLKYLGEHIFWHCPSLTSITVDKYQENYFSKDGVLFNKNMTEIIICPEGKAGKYIIPDSVKNIKDSAFYFCGSLTSVIIPDSVTSIGNDAFYFCENLETVSLPDSVTNIGSSAFRNCSNLKSINIPDGVTKIEAMTFAFCPTLTSIIIPDGVTSIREFAFEFCSSLNSITIPNSVKSVIRGAFSGCEKLKDVYYTGSKSQWEKIAFEYSNDYLLNATIHYNYVPAPTSVTGLKLKGRSGDALRIAWTKNTSADGYIIEMKDGSKWTRVGKITNNSTVEFKKSKLKAGTAYTFRVKAYKMDGKTARYGTAKTISVRTNPSATTGLKLKARAADALRLTWAKNTSADGYIIEMKSGSSWTRVGKITNNSTVEFKKSKLKAGTAYTFRVKAYKMSGKIALYGATKTISVRTNPSVVSGLKLKNSAKDAVRLSWTQNTSADGYIIEMKSGNSWTRVGKITNNSTVEFKKSKLKSNTSYTFRVKAYKMSGKTALYGAAKTITVKTK